VRWTALALAALALAGCTGGAHRATPSRLETVLQDDDLLLHHPAQLRRTMAALKALGVDRVRITASWSIIAPAPRSRVRPRFDAANPDAYPGGAWRDLDRAVRAVTAAGLRPMIDVAFFAPRWAVRSGFGGPDAYRDRPDPHQFGLFAEAVARRYDGASQPAVRLWTTWNEPNHPTFLMPQWEHGRPVAADHYRRMHELAYAAIKRVASDNRVLIGATSSIGSAGHGRADSIRPLRFLRELACVDERLRPLRTHPCRDFRPLQADGFAHHPYMHRQPPEEHLPNPDSVGVADLARLSRLLAQLHAHGRTERRLPVYVTEFGYETDPPDPKHGVSLATQARYLSEAGGLVVTRPDLRMFAQFLVRDLPDDVLYQTGLVLPDGVPKPALFSFPVAFRVRAGVASGQVRPGDGTQRVAIERRRGRAWSTLGAPFSTRSDGVFVRRGLPRGTYRLRWQPPTGPLRFSLPAPG
jgi:hypothetical protein